MRVEPVGPDRWDDLCALFGPSGAYAGCWCMWWRVSAREFDANVGDGLCSQLQSLVEAGAVPGLLGYVDDEPVGWISLGPREDFGRIERSPKLKRVDDEPTWSIVCFFIRRDHRGEGVARELLDAAVDHARAQGAVRVEGYPIDMALGNKPAASLYTGTLGMFESARFVEIARRGGRPIVRREL